jgi:two-component system phosphate regulon response regulator PhoB
VKLILLVEDSKFLRMANSRALAKAGFRVVTANDGEEALRVATDGTPDLILLDMLLPKMGGVEVLRALRKNPRTTATPIVVMTGLAKSNESKLMLEGADGFFEKSKLDEGSDSFIEMVRSFVEEASEGHEMPCESEA